MSFNLPEYKSNPLFKKTGPISSPESRVNEIVEKEVAIRRTTYWWVVRALIFSLLCCYGMAEWIQVTTEQLSPGHLIFNNSSIQLWIAAYRLLFILLIGLGLFTVLNKYLNLTDSFQSDISPTQRLWLTFAVIFSLCLLFVLLLMVRLPESVSVGP